MAAPAKLAEEQAGPTQAGSDGAAAPPGEAEEPPVEVAPLPASVAERSSLPSEGEVEELPGGSASLPAAVAERRSLPTEGEVGARTWAPAATRGAPKRRNVDRRRETT